MVNARKNSPQVHDLVRLTPSAIEGLSADAEAAEESWVASSLSQAPWAVVRRIRPSAHGRVPIGVRGPERRQRWAAEISESAISDAVTPLQARNLLATRSRLGAFRALQALIDAPIRVPWGVGGSLGFEIATGTKAVKESSDVDLIVYADTPVTDAELRELEMTAESVQELSGTRIDILVETPVGAVAFAELARAVGLLPKPTVMLRTPDGPELAKYPWS